jgi:proteasome lid subunit RPN8/RPN11
MSEKDYPAEYKALLEKIEALEKKLGMLDIDSLVEDKIKETEELSEDTITEDVLHIAPSPEILIKPKAYLKLAKHALTYANDSIPKRKWVEVIGLLTGKISNEETPIEQVLVEDYWPVDQGDAVSVEIVDQNIFTEIFHKKNNEHFICGWAHSHPSYTPFLSGDDYQTHLRYQTFWNKSIALVIDPLMISPTDYGIGVFRIDNNKRSYYKLSVEVEGLSSEACFESINTFMKNQNNSQS